MLDEPVVLAGETKRAKSERLDVRPVPQERGRLFLDPRASPKGDEGVELCDQALHISRALRAPLAQLSLDFCEVASRHGDLDANRIDQVLVAFHAQTVRTPLQAPRFLLVPQQDMGAGTSEQSPDVQRARRRNIGGHHRLGMGCEVTDRLPVTGSLLDSDQRRNGVQPVMRREIVRHLIVRLSEVASLVQAARRDGPIDGEEVDQCNVIGIGELWHEVEASSDPGESLLVLTP